MKSKKVDKKAFDSNFKAKINPFLKDVLKNTPRGEDPKKGGRKYHAPGLFKMDGTPIKGKA